MALAIQIILVLASIALIVSVLAQNSKSAGLGAAYGEDTETFGSRGRQGNEASESYHDPGRGHCRAGSRTHVPVSAQLQDAA